MSSPVAAVANTPPPAGCALLARVRRETDAARTIIANALEGPSVEDHLDLLPSTFDVPELEQWDFSMPTVVPDNYASNFDKRAGWQSNASDIPKFKPSLKNTPSDESCRIKKELEEEDEISWKVYQKIFSYGFVVAGGRVCNLIQAARASALSMIDSSDIDLFAPGTEPEQAEKNFFELIRDIRNMNLWGNAIIDRTLNCITATFEDGGVEFQLITRTYRSIAEILFSFDLAPCAAAWDGDNVYLTPGAVVAHRIGVFEVDLTKRRHSFEARIVKYVNDKQFAAVLPNMNMDSVKAPKRGIYTTINLPKLDIHVNKIHKNCMIGKLVHSQMPSKEYAEERKIKQCRVYGALPYFDREELFKHNVWRLLLNDAYLVWSLSADHTTWELIFNLEPPVVIKVLVTILASNHAKINHHLARFKAIVGCDPSAIGNLTIWACSKPKLDAPMCGMEEHPALYAKVAETAERLIARARELRRVTFAWKVAEKGTDLHDRKGPADEAIFKTVRISAQDWYGEHYTPYCM